MAKKKFDCMEHHINGHCLYCLLNDKVILAARNAKLETERDEWEECHTDAEFRVQALQAQVDRLKGEIEQAGGIAETGEPGYILPDDGKPIEWLGMINQLALASQKQVEVFASGEPHPQVFVCHCGTVVGPILDDNAHCDCGDPAYGFEYHRYTLAVKAEAQVTQYRKLLCEAVKELEFAKLMDTPLGEDLRAALTGGDK